MRCSKAPTSVFGAGTVSVAITRGHGEVRSAVPTGFLREDYSYLLAGTWR